MLQHRVQKSDLFVIIRQTAKCRVVEQLNLVAAANVARCTLHTSCGLCLPACDRAKIYIFVDFQVAVAVAA